MRGKILKVMAAVICMAAVIMNFGCVAMAAEGSNDKAKDIELEKVEGLQFSDGERNYGALYGTQYNGTDTQEWLTLQLEGRGLKIVNDDGTAIVMVDKYGGIYLSGTVYVNSEKYAGNAAETSGFNNFNLMILYVMVMVLFVLCMISLCKNRTPKE